MGGRFLGCKVRCFVVVHPTPFLVISLVAVPSGHNCNVEFTGYMAALWVHEDSVLGRVYNRIYYQCHCWLCQWALWCSLQL